MRVPQSSTAMNRRTLTWPGARVDVDDADVAAVRVGEVRRVVDHLRVEVALDALGQLERAVRVHRDLLDRPAPLGVALDVPAAELPLEVVGRALERRGGDDPGLVAHLARDERRRRAGHRRRARAVGAEAERRVVGVAVDDLDVLRRDAELVADDLRERRLVALALASAPTAAACALPVGCTRRSQPSAMPRPRMSMCLRGPAPTPSVKNEMPMPMYSPLARFSACSRRSSS